ncbi:transposase [Micromonospora aurantiaca]|uniref:transposase n=1 Tax=Micromonospora aurantiaca (nom. illeg.) TaxID=47850 RepID=UPI0034522339
MECAATPWRDRPGPSLEARRGTPSRAVRQLTKTVLETALNEEMTDHLCYARHETDGAGSGIVRNGTEPRTLLTEPPRVLMFPGLGGADLVDSSGSSLVEERRVPEIPARVSSQSIRCG